MSEYFEDLCNLQISQGAICDILGRFAVKATPAYKLISNRMQSATVAGADETGARINGKKRLVLDMTEQDGNLYRFFAKPRDRNN